MSLPQKLDQETAGQLRSILLKLNLGQNKVTNDLENETIEIEDNYAIDDILESAGLLTPEQAKDLMEEVHKMREDEWN